MKRPLLLGVATVLLSGVAQAAGPAPAPPAPRAPEVQYQKTTRYDFDNDEVQGTLVRPDGDAVVSGGRARFESLIKPRMTFVSEIVKSADHR